MTVFKPQIFFQGIFYPDGSLYGVEILTKGLVGSEPPGKSLDLFCLLTAANSIVSLIPEELRRSTKFHFNIYLENVSQIPFHQLLVVIPNAVLEIVEKGIIDPFYLSYLRLIEGIPLALDDFGRGRANFDLLPYFQIVKLDRDVVDGKVLKPLIDVLKFQGKTVILEKALREDSSFNADAYQGYEWHKPEPLENLREFLSRRRKGD